MNLRFKIVFKNVLQPSYGKRNNMPTWVPSVKTQGSLLHLFWVQIPCLDLLGSVGLILLTSPESSHIIYTLSSTLFMFLLMLHMTLLSSLPSSPAQLSIKESKYMNPSGMWWALMVPGVRDAEMELGHENSGVCLLVEEQIVKASRVDGSLRDLWNVRWRLF